MPHTDTLEVELDVTPSRLWQATFDLHNIGPQILPEVLQSFTYVKGDGGVGSIREVKIKDPTTGEIVTNREVFDIVDEKTHTFKYHIENAVENKYKSYNVSAALVPAGTDSAKTKVLYTIESEPLGDAGGAANEGHTKLYLAFFKGLEAYLLAHENDYS